MLGVPMRRRFFVERFDGARAVVRGETATHLTRVLRAAQGQLYELSDGESVWLGRVQWAGRDEVEFALVEPVMPIGPTGAAGSPAPPLEISLLLSIVKFDRMEWCLEKATELGASEIVPLAAERSARALVAASVKRAARWERILLESAQQSRRLRPPVLRAAIKPASAFAACEAELRLLCSEERDAQPMKGAFAARESAKMESVNVKSAPRMAIAIGPEGGWTEEESQAAVAAGFCAVSLGENILRTETAVIAALAVVQYAVNSGS
jgi:16S rRNA (uracil1498-N3)-methyltransferase